MTQRHAIAGQEVEIFLNAARRGDNDCGEQHDYAHRYARISTAGSLLQVNAFRGFPDEERKASQDAANAIPPTPRKSWN